MFSKKDIEQMNELGINPGVIKKQIDFFKNGFPFVNLNRPATINDGVKKFSENEIKKLQIFYDENSKNEKIVKFVPASGAATRMFKDLYNFLDEWDGSNNITLDKYKNIFQFFKQLTDFAFYNELVFTLKSMYNVKIDKEFNQNNYVSIISALLTKKGLNYGELPKALLKFHKYKNEIRTSLEEHLVEGAKYCVSKNNKVYIHFTVTPEHLSNFKKLVTIVKSKYQQRFNIKLIISYSIQKPSTDTIAVTLDNKPFRISNNKLFFRPGGHGALIENLNELDGNITFIKNIDNVVTDKLKNETIKYKKVIGGILIKLRNEIFSFLVRIDKGEKSENIIKEITEFYRLNFFIDYSKYNYNVNDYFKILNRPIRVCGMVKNLGEPGGGPYWVNDANGRTSLQIIESSQINQRDDEQLNIFKKATHFNPVDLVCSVYNYKHKKFDLKNFIDTKTGFISKKSKDGSELKALELPGLWNGAMANWNTIFVEVPLITFNPVKTINDLLRKEHQT